MSRKPFLFILITISAVSLACSLQFNLPVDEITTGETVTEPINIELPEGDAQVNLTFGAGELTIEPGNQAKSITGTAKYNVGDLKPKVEIEGNKITISTGNFEITGIPNFDEDIENSWDLEMGTGPMELQVNAGAYKGSYELGGLAITALDITDGASDVTLAFSAPNLTGMDTFRYTTGASSLNLKGLANSNFEMMTFRGGAGDFTLDFSGELKRDAKVQIDSGLSHVKVIIPENTAARVVFQGGLVSINAGEDWNISGKEYSKKGSGPTLTIYVDMAAGDFDLLTD